MRNSMDSCQKYSWKKLASAIWENNLYFYPITPSCINKVYIIAPLHVNLLVLLSTISIMLSSFIKMVNFTFLGFQNNLKTMITVLIIYLLCTPSA